MTKRRRNKLILSLVVALIVMLLAQLPPVQRSIDQGSQTVADVHPGQYRITHVSDGDTFTVNMDGHEESIRLIGVDTPETVKPNSPTQCFGPEASTFSKKWLQNTIVRLQADPTNDNRDRYQRLLRYAYAQDGTLVNKKLIEEGYGFAYLSFTFEKKDEFAAVQTVAQQTNRGLWAACQTHQVNGRWQTNDLQ